MGKGGFGGGGGVGAMYIHPGQRQQDAVWQEFLAAAEREKQRKNAQYYNSAIHFVMPNRADALCDFASKGLFNNDPVSLSSSADVSEQLAKIKEMLNSEQRINPNSFAIGSDVSKIINEAQTLFQSRTSWLQQNVKVELYRRAEYLFNWFQHKFHADLIYALLKLERDKYDVCKHPIEVFEKIKKYIELYEKIINEATDSSDILDIDKYVNAPDRQNLKILYVELTQIEMFHHNNGGSNLLELTLDLSAREFKRKHVIALKNILRTQLRNIPDQRFNGLAKKFSRYAAVDMLESQALSAPLKLSSPTVKRYEALLTLKYQHSFRPSENLIQECLTWFSKQASETYDIIMFHAEVKKRVDKEIQKLNAIAALTANAVANRSSISLSNLNHNNFTIALDDVVYPALHIAMRRYAIETDEYIKIKCFSNVQFLLNRGALPFESTVMVQGEAIKQTAFDFANSVVHHDWMEWKLLAAITKTMITRSSFSEKLRLGLMTYCQNSEIEIASWFWRVFHSMTEKSLRLKQVFKLVSLLNDANENCCEDKLISECELMIACFKPRDGSNLLKLLKEVLAENNHGLVSLKQSDLVNLYTPTHCNGNHSFFSSQVELADLGEATPAPTPQPTVRRVGY
jgi:hypothetical protein